MKEVPLEEWAKRLLEDQIARLGELRNASPRDPGFKLWRQTTLTVIQRVWPGNLPKSEAFRRIPFSTPSGKSSRAQVRDYYERGCAEAVAYLKRLMVEIDDGGLKAPAESAPARPASLPMSPPTPAPVLSRPTDEPKDMGMLDEGLVGTGPLSIDQLDARADATPPPQFVSPEFDREPDLGAPSASPPVRFTSPLFGDEPPSRPLSDAAPVAGPPPAPEHDTAEPRARREPVSPPAQAAPAPPESAGAERPPTPGAAGRPASGRTPRVVRPGDRRALKEMLGFVDEHGTPGFVEDSATAPPEVDEPLAPARPAPAFGIPAHRSPAGESVAHSRAPQESVASEPEEPVAPPAAAMPVARPTPIASPAAPVARPAPAAPAPTASSAPPTPALPASSASSASPTPAPVAAAPVLSREEVEPDPFAHDEEDEVEGADLTLDLDPDEGEVAEEFLRTSPVLSAQARPLNAPRHIRSAPGTETPIAGALAALAGDITRLGVPEGHRAATRAALLGLARQFDERTVNWVSIRQAVTLVLEYPALARRIIPLLVPYLDLE